MSNAPLIDSSRIEVKLGEYGVGSASALSDAGLLLKVQDYRRQLSVRMIPLNHDQIQEKIPSSEFHVSRKIDGEFSVLIYEHGNALLLNPGGTVRVGLPLLKEAAEVLSAAGISQAMFAGELYVKNPTRRPRVHDVVRVARNPDSVQDLETLHLAVFDILSLNGSGAPSAFVDCWATIEKTFANCKYVRPVDSQIVKNPSEIEKLFADWVEEHGEEGLVARSDAGGWFKVKPRHTLDVAVVGFTESIDDRQGMLHDLLVAVRRSDGSFHLLCKVGGGFSDEQRREFLSDLKDMVVESEYAEINSDHVAYQMVRPEWVIEMSCLDLVSQTTRGGTVNRMVLNWNSELNKYQNIRRLPLAAVISPQFVRKRDDKTVHPQEIRIEQLAEIVEIPQVGHDASQLSLPKSEILRREVYTKEQKGQTMIRKFVMWKTNKEQISEDFPAYVIHYTDFSPNRGSPLNREIRISNDLDQINQLWTRLIEANIKRGWNPYEIPTPVPAVAMAASAEAPAEPLEAAGPKQAASKRKPRKKAAAKKSSKKSGGAGGA